MTTQTPAQPTPPDSPGAPGGPGGPVAPADGDGNGAAPTPPRASGSPSAVRPMGAGIPTEKPRDFRNSSRRLLSLLREDHVPVWWIVALATVGVALTVVGPLILGHATDLVVQGLLSPSGIDFGELHMVLLGALALFLASSGLTYVSAYLMAGIIQRTMRRMRADVEDKLNRLPLAYVDGQQRGDLLSRVTNDIDNIAQSLQQTLNQLVSQALTLVGVLALMIWISPLLALVAIVSVPVSVLTMRGIAKRSKARFIAQWRHTGALERAGRGGLHRPRHRQGVRPPARGRGAVPPHQRRAVHRQLRRPVRLGRDPAGDDVPRQSQLRDHRRAGRAEGHLWRPDDRRRAGLPAVHPAVPDAAHPDGGDGQPAAVGRGVGRAGVRAARRGGRAPRRRRRAARGHPSGPGGVRARVVLVPPRPAADHRPVARGRAGPDGGDRRADRRGEDHPRQPADAVLRARRRPHHPRRPRHRVDAAARPARRHRHGAAGHLAVRRHDPRQHRLRQPRRHRATRSWPRPRPPTSTGSSTRCPTATTR